MPDTPFSATGANSKPDLETHADTILRASGSALRHYSMGSTRQRILDAVEAVRTHDRDDLLELISEAISDSLDVDWRPIDAAHYVIRALEDAGIVKAIEGECPE